MKCIRAIQTVLLLTLCCLFLFGYYGHIGREVRSNEQKPRTFNDAQSLQIFLTKNSEYVLSSESEFEGNICSGVLDDPYYRELMQSYLDAWYKFVPHQSKMDSSNCWYVENFNTLPNTKIAKFKSLVNYNRFGEYSKKERDYILGGIFSKGNKALVSEKPTQHHFCLPNVNVIGFAKTGSTFLYQYLVSTSRFLAKPHTKECQFWREILRMQDQKNRELSVLLYLYQFFSASQQIRNDPEMFTIDASNSVSFAPAQPLKEGQKDACVLPLIISQTMPNIKLIASTRDPVERLWSDFLFHCPPKLWASDKVTSGMAANAENAALLFHNQTVAAINEFRACIQKGHSQFHCTALVGSLSGKLTACRKIRLSISMYYVHLVKYFQIFPREQLHVARLEDMVSDPQDTMDQVWKFIGKEPRAKFNTIDKKVKSSPWRSINPKMLPETRELLEEFFHPYNVKLSQLLNDQRYLWSRKA